MNSIPRWLIVAELVVLAPLALYGVFGLFVFIVDELCSIDEPAPRRIP